MDEILNFKHHEDDLYDILGCDETSSVEQILAEYKHRAINLHPDKNQDNKDAVEGFQKLSFAKEVLCDESRRQSYDRWKRSGMKIPFKMWEDKAMNTRMTMHWVTNAKKDYMIEGNNSYDNQLHTSANKSPNEDKNKVYWFKGSSNDEILKKFRNYEI